MDLALLDLSTDRAGRTIGYDQVTDSRNALPERKRLSRLADLARGQLGGTGYVMSCPSCQVVDLLRADFDVVLSPMPSSVWSSQVRAGTAMEDEVVRAGPACGIQGVAVGVGLLPG